MTRTCPKVRAARAERLFSLTRPIIFLICDVVVAVVDAKAPCYFLGDVKQECQKENRKLVKFFDVVCQMTT